MERQEAINKLQKIIKEDLHVLAKQYDITVEKSLGKVNKGWAGHVIERYLGLPLNSARSPNFGSWELKTASLKYKKDGSLTVKETMAVTMIDAVHVAQTSFADSHLLAKLKKAVIVSRIVGKNFSEPSYIHSINTFDLKPNTEIYNIIEKDYNLVKDLLLDLGCEAGFNKLTGRMGHYIQPRTKGSGHGSKTRAFYARTKFLNLLLLPQR